jgi:phospholipid-transporting ATPase
VKINDDDDQVGVELKNLGATLEPGTQVHPSDLLAGKEVYPYHVTPHYFGAEHISDAQMRAPTNKRKSTQYTWLTFFPIAIVLQLTKVVNIFYLFTGCLQLFKAIQTNSPLAVFIPVSCIIALGVAKEMVGECKRYKNDKKVNATPVTVLKPKTKEFEQLTLADLRVGDIVKIQDEEEIPADCVLLQVEGNKSEAFVRTSALDGERNLKPKLASATVSTNFDKIFDGSAGDQRVKFWVDCINPIKDLYKYEGRMKMQLNEADPVENIDVGLE